MKRRGKESAYLKRVRGQMAEAEAESEASMQHM